jgi:hypothetical protein
MKDFSVTVIKSKTPRHIEGCNPRQNRVINQRFGVGRITSVHPVTPHAPLRFCHTTLVPSR